MRTPTAAEFVRAALEACIYIDPTDHGLSLEELVEIGGRCDFRPGEINDAIRDLRHQYIQSVNGQFRLASGDILGDFIYEVIPDFRNPDAFQLVHEHLRELRREVGSQNARVERRVLVELGKTADIAAHDMEVAITVLHLGEMIVINDGFVRFVHGREHWALPRDQIRGWSGAPRRYILLEKVHSVVADVIQRRCDARPLHAEPLDAFKERLASFGAERFEMWWVQMSTELRRSDPTTMPTTCCVLAAALAEGALGLVARPAFHSGKCMVKGLNEDDPRHWKFEALAKAAKSGSNAILDEPVYQRCAALNEIRQRIHAGRLLHEVPTGPLPDLRPDEARSARETLNAVLRRILDWLDENPDVTASGS